MVGALLPAAVLFSANHALAARCLPTELSIPAGDTLTLETGCTWTLLEPVRHGYENMIPGGTPAGLGVDTLSYAAGTLGDEELTLVPEAGVFYLGIGLAGSGAPDTLRFVEPPNLVFPGSVVQIAVRTDDSYIGYLMELFNTPFIMTPRLTPGGVHQTDARLGSDCAAFAVYGRRRMGCPVEYLGPSGIRRYLESLINGQLRPGRIDGVEVYMTDAGATMPVGEGGLIPGDVLHFGSQVSVFYQDGGVPGILDPCDLVIQSLFDGPCIVTLRENGFYPLPLCVLRWRN